MLSPSAYIGLGVTPAELAARYRANAVRCLLLANRIEAVAEKAAMIGMAQAWIDLGLQAEKNEHLVVVYETPEPKRM